VIGLLYVGSALPTIFSSSELDPTQSARVPGSRRYKNGLRKRRATAPTFRPAQR
jgi:hypothetical protein